MSPTKTKLSNISNKKAFKTDLSQLFKLLNAKKLFFMLILINLLIQIAITYYISLYFDSFEITKDANQRRQIILGAHIMSFVLIFVLIFPMPIWLKFVIFSLFSVLMGVVLEDVKIIADMETIKTAFIGTISIFVSMFAFGVALIINNIQLTYKFGLGLFFALLLLLIISLVQFFLYTSSILKKIILIFSLMLFSVYIIYTTNSILQKDYNGDFITASLDYYLEIFNIFVSLLGMSEGE